MCQKVIFRILKSIKFQPILFIFILILSPLAHSQTNATDIRGTYFCVGNDFSTNNQYTVEITVTKEGDVYRQEIAEQGEGFTTNAQLGTTIFVKDSKDTFATVFWPKNNVNKLGIVISQIQPDGSWQGIWKWMDKPEINTQICKKRDLLKN